MAKMYTNLQDQMQSQQYFLHRFAFELTPIRTKLFQLSLDIGKVSDDWGEASIVPIFKKRESN